MLPRLSLSYFNITLHLLKSLWNWTARTMNRAGTFFEGWSRRPVQHQTCMRDSPNSWTTALWWGMKVSRKRGHVRPRPSLLYLWASIFLRKDADIVPCYKTTVSTSTVCFPGTSHNYLVEKKEQLNVPCALYAVNKLACTTGINLETITVLRNRKQAHANISEYMTKDTH